jgi:DNA repair protein RadC
MDSNQEYFYCLYLNQQKKLIDKKLLFKGTLNKSLVHPREIFKGAYLSSAAYIICIHNHPSGNVIPSNEDIIITENLVKIGKMQGIPVIDHIIIGDNNYYSFYENDLIGKE